MKHAVRIFGLVLGLALVAYAGYLVWDNTQEEQVAQVSSRTVVAQFAKELETVEDPPDLIPLAPEPAPQEEIIFPETQTDPAVFIDGHNYMGVLSIPQLNLHLPVETVCTDANLLKTPCVYAGSLAEGYLMILAHNYKVHFGKLGVLQAGDQITLVDAVGQVHTYQFSTSRTIEADKPQALYEPLADLALLTCVYGQNTHRIVYQFHEI